MPATAGELNSSKGAGTGTETKFEADTGDTNGDEIGDESGVDAGDDAGNDAGDNTGDDAGGNAGDDTEDDTIETDLGEPASTKVTRTSIKSVRIKFTKLVYNGKARTQDKTTVVRALVGKKLKKLTLGQDYKITYKNNKNIGTATMIVTGIGSYKGKIKKTFKILPPDKDFLRITYDKFSFTAKWKKGTCKLSGYQIQYSTKKNFSGKKKTLRVKWTKKSPKVMKKTVEGLDPEKTYYIRIRSYKELKGKTYYSAWSITRKLKKSIIPITKVKINSTRVTLKEGKKKKLKVSILPKNTTDSKKVTWRSADRRIAVVSSEGVITAKCAGATVITGTLGNHSVTCKVTVKMPAMLTIIDDDGSVNFMNKLMPIVKEKKISISTAVTPERIESGLATWMTWDMIEECQANGAEVLCHTLRHVDSDATNAMTQKEIEADYLEASRIFAARGYTAASKILVYSYGTGKIAKAQKAASKVYDCGIEASGNTTNTEKTEPYQLKRYAIQTTYHTELSSMKELLSDLSKNGGWMIWTLHANQSNLTEKKLNNLRKAIDYAKKKGIKIVTARKGYKEYYKRYKKQ